jgi:hypothetical protein
VSIVLSLATGGMHVSIVLSLATCLMYVSSWPLVTVG